MTRRLFPTDWIWVCQYCVEAYNGDTDDLEPDTFERIAALSSLTPSGGLAGWCRCDLCQVELTCSVHEVTLKEDAQLVAG